MLKPEKGKMSYASAYWGKVLWKTTMAELSKGLDTRKILKTNNI